MPKTLDEILEEIKQTDPNSYKEIIEDSSREIEKIRKRGGKRIGAGRPKVFPCERKTITKIVSINSVDKIREISRNNDISENEALDKLINAGYEHLKEAS